MYDNPSYMNLTEACAFLGVGRNTCMRLCRELPHNFPAVKVGKRYQIDRAKLQLWREDWYNHKFTI